MLTPDKRPGSVSPSPWQWPQDEAGFDRLPQADVVRYKPARRPALQYRPVTTGSTLRDGKLRPGFEPYVIGQQFTQVSGCLFGQEDGVAPVGHPMEVGRPQHPAAVPRPPPRLISTAVTGRRSTGAFGAHPARPHAGQARFHSVYRPKSSSASASRSTSK